MSSDLRPVVEALPDDDDSVRFAAIAALADRLDPSLLPAIEQRLTDPDSYVRSTAAEHYAKLTEG
jgi:HEAT repeat protein